jgi:hypothetical protein
LKRASSDFIALAVLTLGGVVWFSSLPWNGNSGATPIAGEILKLIIPAIAAKVVISKISTMGLKYV